jgi:diguanylate cyclase (GGDEF)-like protein/PAS domain S-box-containing protein
VDKSERWCIAGASVVSLVGIVVMYGWFIKCPPILQIIPTFAPMKFNTAVGFLASGLAILLYLSRYTGSSGPGTMPRKAATSFGTGSLPQRPVGNVFCVLAASIPLLIGGATLAEHILNRRLGIDQMFFHGYNILTHSSPHPGQISVLTSLSLVLVGTALVCLSQQAKGRWLCAIAGILSFVVLVTGLVRLMGYATGISFSYTFGHFTNMALHTAVCFAILGATIAVLARNAVCDTQFRFRWGAIAAVTTVTIATVVWWQAIVAQETMHINAVTDSVAADIGNVLGIRMRADADDLGHMADRWSPTDDRSGRAWRDDATNYVRDCPEYQAVEWIDPSLHVRWVVPIDGNEFVFAVDPAAAERMRAAERSALAGHRITISKSSGLIQGERGYLVYAPILRQGHVLGLIAGVCRVGPVISVLFPSFLKNYRLEILEDDDQLFAQRQLLRGKTAYSREITADMYGIPWSIRVTPTSATIRRSASFLSTLVLIAGLLLSFFMGTVIRLMGASRLSAESERDARLLAASISEISTNIIYVFDLETRSFTYVNKYAAEFVGYTLKSLSRIEDVLAAAIHPDDCAFALAHFADFATMADDGVIEFEQRVRHVSGAWKWVWLRERIFQRRPDGTPSHIMGTGNDISERRASEDALRDSNLLLESAIDQSPIGMSIVAPDGRWLRVNDALCAIVGYTREELLARDFLSITHPDDIETDVDAKRQLLAGEIYHYSVEKRYLHKGGRVVWIMVSVSLVNDSMGKPAYFVTQVQDITLRMAADQQVNDYATVLEFQKNELEKANALLGEMVMLDSLTGIKNRRALFDWLQSLFVSATRYDEPLAVILLDVDHFKSYNDAFGHLAGDEVLRRIASILGESARECDMVARYGGEEFAVLCPKTDINGALILAERIRSAIESNAWFERPVTASLGVTALSLTTQTSEQLLADADTALYRSKELGRNCVSVHAQNAVAMVDTVAAPVGH